MGFKILRDSLSLIIVILHYSEAGIIGGHHHQEPSHHHEFHDHHHHKATSYMHFHGPVEGPEFEVKVPYVEPHHEDHHNHLEHHHHHHEPHYVMDYVAHPKYEYSYGVEDYHTGDFHSQKETRDGGSVTGEYSVIEPGGRVRVVSYHAGKDGFHAHVHTSGKNDHSSYQGHHNHNFLASASTNVEQSQEQGQELHEYPVSLGEGGR